MFYNFNSYIVSSTLNKFVFMVMNLSITPAKNTLCLNTLGILTQLNRMVVNINDDKIRVHAKVQFDL